MSFQALTWATRQKVGGVTGKAILLMLANYADRDGSCMPGQETLAEECECSPRAVRDWLTKFEAMGLIRREERRRDNGYRTSDRIILALTVETAISPAQSACDQPAGFSGENGSGENDSPENPSDLTGSICRANRTSKGNRKTHTTPRTRTPIEELNEVLDLEHAQQVVEHRKRIGKPLTGSAASKLAAKLGRWRDPNEAADEMLANGWQGFEVAWMEGRRSRTGSPQSSGSQAAVPKTVAQVLIEQLAASQSMEAAK